MLDRSNFQVTALKINFTFVFYLFSSDGVPFLNANTTPNCRWKLRHASTSSYKSVYCQEAALKLHVSLVHTGNQHTRPFFLTDARRQVAARNCIMHAHHRKTLSIARTPFYFDITIKRCIFLTIVTYFWSSGILFKENS